MLNTSSKGNWETLEKYRIVKPTLVPGCLFVAVPPGKHFKARGEQKRLLGSVRMDFYEEEFVLYQTDWLL